MCIYLEVVPFTLPGCCLQVYRDRELTRRLSERNSELRNVKTGDGVNKDWRNGCLRAHEWVKDEERRMKERQRDAKHRRRECGRKKRGAWRWRSRDFSRMHDEVEVWESQIWGPGMKLKTNPLLNRYEYERLHCNSVVRLLRIFHSTQHLVEVTVGERTDMKLVGQIWPKHWQLSLTLSNCLVKG